VKLPDLSGINIIEACGHKSLMNIPLSLGQRTFLKASDGLPLDQEELDLYCIATGHDSYTPGRFVRNPVLTAGRRFGKTHHVAVPQAIHAAVFRNYENTRPGERPTVLFLATTKDQADIDHRAVVEVFRNSPTLKAFMPIFTRRGTLSLRNAVDVIVQKNDLRSNRGLPVVFCCAEELNFWRSEDDPTQNPAEEVLAAVRPALIQFLFGRLLMVSSPWNKSGPMWSAFSKRLETREPLCMRMTSMQGNPTLDPALLEAERLRDPDRYEREINAEWLDAASALLPGDALDAAIAKNRHENPPKTGVMYVLGLDAAFRSDAFAAAWTHAEGERVIVDYVRSWQPQPKRPVNFSVTMDSIIETCKYYGCRKAYADQVANEVIKQKLAQHGIALEQTSTGGRRASGVYQSLRAKCLAGQLELLDHAELIGQLRRLEIVRTSGGGETCAASSGHDDIAVATALSVYQSCARGIKGRYVRPEVILCPR
jgi:hypothetical protein